MLVSESGAGNTVIDCQMSGNKGFYFHSNEDRCSVIKGLTISNGSQGVFLSGASPWLQQCRIVGNAYEGGISAYNSAALFTDCVIQNNSGVSGAGMSISGMGALVVSNTVIQGNTATTLDGGGIMVSGGGANFINCTISQNGSAAGRGGGVYVYGTTDASFRMQSCQIISNSAVSGGGIHGASAATLSGTEVRGNTAVTGGGLYLSNIAAVAFCMQSCLITSNKATSGGGLQACGAAAMSGTVIRANTAVTGGGAIIKNVGGNSPFLDDMEISYNGGPSNQSGGGLYIDSSAVVTMRTCRVKSNTSQGNGGGLYAAADMVMTNGEISGNQTVSGFGGGVYLMCPGQTPGVFEGVAITGNTASGSGGGVYVNASSKPPPGVTNDSRVIFRNCAVSGNAAMKGGGVCYVDVSTFGSLHLESCQIEDNTAQNEGGGLSGGTNGITISDSRFLRNQAMTAAGIHSTSRALQVDRCVINSNAAQNTYGGFSSGSNNYACFSSSLLQGNRAQTNGGAGYCISGVVQNCTVVENWVSNSPAIGGIASADSNVTIRNTILWGNYGNQLSGAPRVSYSCIQGGWTTNGASHIVTNNPLLVGGYHLLNPHSPCFNAGTTNGMPATDINGDARQSGAAPDIGCDELILDDTDSDSMPDEWEQYYFGGLDHDGTGDTDNDGLTDAMEYDVGVDPMERDTDHDGLPDGWEVARGLDPTNPGDAGGDWDGDGIANSNDFQHGSFAVRVMIEDPDHNDDTWNLILNNSVVASCNAGNTWHDSQVVYVEQGRTARFMLQRPEAGQGGVKDEYNVSFVPVDWPSNQAPWIASAGNAATSNDLPWTGDTPPDVSGIYWEFMIPTNMLQQDAKAGGDDALTTDPINTINGNITLDETDLAIPCPSFDLVFARAYNSASSASNTLGRGWTHSLDWSLATVSNSAYGSRAGTFKVMTTGDGQSFWFCTEADGSFTLAPPQTANLALSFASGEFRVTWPGGTVARFDASGVIQRLEDGFHSGLTFTHAAGKLTQVAHDNGKTLTLSYTGDLLTRVDSPGTNLCETYAYSAEGLLTNATRVADGVAYPVQYSYEPVCHVLTQKVNAAGQVFAYSVGYVTNIPAWNGNPAVVTARGTGLALEPSGNRWYAHSLNYTNPGGFCTRVTYDRGDTNVVFDYAYDPVKMRITGITGPGTPGVAAWSNTFTSFGFDAAGNVTNELAKDGGSGETLSALAFCDTRHNVLSNGVAYNGNAVAAWSQFAWNADDTLAAATDPLGRKTAFEYTNGLVSVVRECTNGVTGFETRFSYTTNGLLASVTNANGHGIGFENDTAGYVSRVVPALGPDARFVRNGLGQVTAVIVPGDAGYRTNAMMVNALGQITAMTYPGGLTESFTFDSLGHLTNMVDTAGRTNVITWLPTGKPSSISRWLDGPNPTNVTIGFAYDRQFNTLKITDPMERAVESYKLDAQDRPVSVTNIQSQVMTVNWGVGDYVKGITRFDGTVVTNLYGTDGRLIETRLPGLTNKFSYYADGALKTASNVVGVVTNGFDVLGRRNLEWMSSFGKTNIVGWQFDSIGNVTNIAVSNTLVRYGWTYDAAERPLSLTAQAASNRVSVFQWNYNTNNGLVASVTNPAVTESLGYDILDRATSLVWRTSGGSTNRSFAYSFNAAGMITNVSRENGGYTAYTYDSLDRLLSEKQYASTGLTYAASWNYDLAGNRTMAITNGVTNLYSYAAGNVLTNFGSGTLVQHDLAGNVTNLQYSASRKLGLYWNGRYELTEVRTNGVTVEKYDYDALGRRARIIAGTVTNSFVYSGPHIVAEWSNNVLARSYSHGPGVDNILSMTTYGAATNTYFYLKDAIGSVHALVNTNGVVVEQYRYTAWGEVTVLSSNGTLLAASAYGNRFTFQGREMSYSTGLLFFRSRYYSASLGRWLSKDRIGISGGINLYEFCNSTPACVVDPLGFSGTITLVSWDDGTRYGLRLVNAGRHAWIEYRPDSPGALQTYGTWPKNKAGRPNGLNRNLETNPVYQNAPANEAFKRSAHLSDIQEKALFSYIERIAKEGEKAWSTERNCSSFASTAWAAATSEYLSPAGDDSYDTPHALGEAIFQANGKSHTGTLVFPP